jgi:hypothetical protein
MATAVPVGLTSLFSALYLPESPRWLLLKGRRAEAEAVVTHSAALNNVNMPPFALIHDRGGEGNEGREGEREKEREGHSPSTSTSKKECEYSPSMTPSTSASALKKECDYSDLLRIRSVRNISLPLWAVWGIFGFTYYGIILFVGRLYSTTTDNDTSSSCSFDYSSIFINATSEILGVTVSALSIDRLGRIRTQTVFYFLAGLFVFVMGWSLPVNAMLVVAFLGRMTVMAASVSFLIPQLNYPYCMYFLIVIISFSTLVCLIACFMNIAFICAENLFL